MIFVVPAILRRVYFESQNVFPILVGDWGTVLGCSYAVLCTRLYSVIIIATLLSLLMCSMCDGPVTDRPTVIVFLFKYISIKLPTWLSNNTIQWQ